MSGVFVDSSVFLKILEGEETAKKLFVSLYQKEKLYRNAIVYSEVIYVWIKLVTGKKSFELKKMPDSVREICSEIGNIKAFLDLAKSLPLSAEIEDLAEEMIQKYGLLPNDALIAATCKHYGIKKIATFDDDFKRVDFLEIVEI